MAGDVCPVRRVVDCRCRGRRDDARSGRRLLGNDLPPKLSPNDRFNINGNSTSYIAQIDTAPTSSFRKTNRFPLSFSSHVRIYIYSLQKYTKNIAYTSFM